MLNEADVALAEDARAQRQWMFLSVESFVLARGDEGAEEDALVRAGVRGTGRRCVRRAVRLV